MKKKEAIALLSATVSDIPEARKRFEERHGNDPATDLAAAVIIPVLDTVTKIIAGDKEVEPKQLSEAILALGSVSVSLSTPILFAKYKDGIDEAVKHAAERE